MTEQDNTPDMDLDDTEGHAPRPRDDEDDTEGHAPRPRDDEDDTEGHGPRPRENRGGEGRALMCPPPRRIGGRDHMETECPG